MQTVDVDIRLSWPISNDREDRYGNLVITDRLSGVRVIDLELNAEQITNLLAGSGAKVPATVLDPEIYKRVGKKYVWERVPFYAELIPISTREVTEAMEVYADQQVWAGGWEGYRWSLHNYGWELTVYKYEAVSND